MKAKILMFLFGLLTAVQAHAGDVSYYFWQGKLEGRQVKMACAVKDDVMTGEMFETVDGTDRVYGVAGYKTDGMFDIKVYDDAYGVNHLFFLRADIKGKDLAGIVQPSGKKFRLHKYSDKYARPIDREAGAYSSPYIEGKTYKFSGWDRGGEYVYENAMRVKGKLALWGHTENDFFTLSILRDAGPDQQGSDAIVDCANLYVPDNGDFEYTIPYCGYTFSVKFYDHFLIVRPVSGSSSGCFGSGAAITGIYIAIPAKG